MFKWSVALFILIAPPAYSAVVLDDFFISYDDHLNSSFLIEFDNTIVYGNGIHSNVPITSYLTGPFELDVESLDFQIVVTSGQISDYTFNATGTDPVTTIDFVATTTSFSIFNGEKVNYPSAVQLNYNSVPIPAAAWLFGSALIGLAGIKRKK
jgi:hypothetical protein